MEAVMEKTETQDFIGQKLAVFDEAIQKHEALGIDGDMEDADPKKHSIKVLNHERETADAVTIDAIVRQPLSRILRALETGITTRLYGVTRIVGYYSRTNNWNKSKLSELADRHKGSYKLSECEGLA